MKEKDDILIKHYRKLQYDQAHRERFIANPKAGLEEGFGVEIPSEVDIKIEVVPQEHDTITILLPAPMHEDTSDEAIDAASRRVYDILFTEEGPGGFLTPDEALMWPLRDLRASFFKKD